MLQNFTTAVRELQHTFSDAFNLYRPELYYMRGPGPACRAKTALATGKSVVLLASALSHAQAFANRPRAATCHSTPAAAHRSVEVQAAQRLPATMRTAFNVAARTMTFNGCAAIQTGSEFLAHASFPKPEINCRALINKGSQVASLCSDWYAASCASPSQRLDNRVDKFATAAAPASYLCGQPPNRGRSSNRPSRTHPREPAQIPQVQKVLTAAAPSGRH
jgi:hypothetical protein